MKRAILSFFLISILLFPVISMCNAANDQTKNTGAVSNEDHYKQLYEDQRKYNESILNTVYWALGA